MHVRVRYLDLHTGTVHVHVLVVVLVVGSTRTTAVRTGTLGIPRI